MSFSNAARRGFTIVELLVVITICALLLTLVLPSFANARSVAQLVACQSNQRQNGISMATYSSDTNSPTIARPDMGRGNTSWRGEPTTVVNDRGVGIPTAGQDGYGATMHLGIFNQGSWMINNYGNTATLFCPGLSFERNAIGDRLIDYKTKFKQFVGYWESAGMAGTKPAMTVGYTSYMFNSILLGNGAIGTLDATSPGNLDTYTNSTLYPNTEMLRTTSGTRLSDFKSEYPVTYDQRGMGTVNNARAYHNGTGYNVLRIDGAVRFLQMGALIDAGSGTQMNAGYRTYFNAFRGRAMLLDSSQDNSVYGIIWSQNPFITTNTIWYSLPEAMRIAMTQ